MQSDAFASSKILDNEHAFASCKILDNEKKKKLNTKRGAG